MADLSTNSAMMSDEEKKKLSQQQGVDLGGPTGGVVNGQGGVSTAGIGAGGQGMWTNIQAYLNANKEDTGSADYLQNQYSSQFDKEKDQLNTQANDAKSQAQSQSNSITEAKDHSKEWVNQAAQGYDWGGNHQGPYQDNVNKLDKALTSQYSGPENFSYAFSEPTQNMKTNLSDENAFWNGMKDSYKQRVGGQMNSGVAELQRQFDTTNDNLQNQRQNLLQKYGDLQLTRDNVATDANSAIEKSRQDFGNNQQNLYSDLLGQSNKYQTDIGQNQADANSDYFNNAHEGWDNGYYGFGPQAFSHPFQATADEMQRWLDANGRPRSNSADWSPAAQDYDMKKNEIGQFYKDQEAKYVPKDEEYKKNFNVIQDILKSNTDRKKQGFSVRG